MSDRPWRAELVHPDNTERRGFLWGVRLSGPNCNRVMPDIQEPDARALAEQVNGERTADLERRLAKIAKACLAPVSNDARIDLVQDALIGLGIRELIDAHP